VKFRSRAERWLRLPTGILRIAYLAKSRSLFRVVQEALRNAIKYSGQKQFEVRLHATAAGVELEVSDRGVGFDVASAKKTSGLGLISMRERVHLVNGTIHIDSKPNAGTRIRVTVPFAPPA
jgi:signal transduction histidine kinase